MKYFIFCVLAIWSFAAPAFAQVCSQRSDNTVLVMLDFSRTSEIKHNDSRVLKDLISAHGVIRGDAGYRVSFTNYNSTNIPPDIICKRFTFKRKTDTNQFVQELYAGVELTAKSNQYNYATRLSQDLRRIVLSLGDMDTSSSDEKTVLIFDNLDFFFTSKKDGRSSVGNYLSDGWLSADFSPLVKDTLSLDTNRFEGAKVFVFTDGTQPLSIRTGKRRFFTALFSNLGGNLFYYGPTYTSNRQPSSLLTTLFKKALTGDVAPYTVGGFGDASLLQLINRNGSENISPSDLR